MAANSDGLVTRLSRASKIFNPNVKERRLAKNVCRLHGRMARSVAAQIWQSGYPGSTHRTSGRFLGVGLQLLAGRVGLRGAGRFGDRRRNPHPRQRWRAARAGHSAADLVGLATSGGDTNSGRRADPSNDAAFRRLHRLFLSRFGRAEPGRTDDLVLDAASGRVPLDALDGFWSAFRGTGINPANDLPAA